MVELEDLFASSRLGEEFARKVGELQRAINRAPSDPGLRHAYGCLLLNKGTELSADRGSDGTRLLQEAVVQLEGSLANGGVGEGELLHARATLGEGDEMLQLYLAKLSEARDADTKVHWLAMLALAYMKLDRLSDAEGSIEAAVGSQPDNCELLEIKGDLLGRLGHHEQALACWDRAMALNPEWIPPRFSKAWHLEGIGRYADSLAEWHLIVAWLGAHGYDDDPDWAAAMTRVEGKLRHGARGI
jgi:tetratricopeptide (TPR) repeat protein